MFAGVAYEPDSRNIRAGEAHGYGSSAASNNWDSASDFVASDAE
jgi:hypothetical protein